MSFSTNDRPSNDIEKQLSDKKAELEIIQKQIDASNDNLKEIAKIEDRLKELESEMEKTSVTHNKKLEAFAKEIAKNQERLKDSAEKVKETEAILADNNKKIEAFKDEVAVLNETKRELVESKQALSSSIAELDDKRLETLAKNKEVEKEEKALSARVSELKKVNKKLEALNKEITADNKKEIDSRAGRLAKIEEKINVADDRLELLSENIVEKVKEHEDISRTLADLEKTFDSKIEEIKKAQDNIDQQLGEISFREAEMEKVKEYIRRVIPALSEIDPKALSKIDLSKI